MKSCRHQSFKTAVMIGLAEYKLEDIAGLVTLSTHELDWCCIYTTACRNPYKMKERYKWYCNMNESRRNLGAYA